MSRIALVAGGTGLVGAALLRRLAGHPAYAEIRALGRRAPPAPGPGVRFIESDLRNLGALGAALAADDVFCCLGTTLRAAGSKAAFERVDHDMVVDLARAARQAGARRFIVISAVGASATSPAFYSRVKARMEQAVMALPFEAVHVVRPSLLLGARTELRPGERVGQALSPLLAPLLRGPLAKYRPVRAEEVAESMVRLALEGARGAHVHHL